MVLAIDIGNTNIVMGCISRERISFIERLSTVRTKTELEYAVDIKTVLDIYHMKKTELEGCIISSVVPQITNVVRLAAEKILDREVVVLGPGVKTGLNIQMDNPASLGADLVANAVAGIALYPLPLAIIDMGTASTVSVVDAQRHYVGGMIFPGIGVSLDALTARASQLSGISIESPKRVIGKNTIECMRSGLIYSNAAALDGIVERMEEELGQKLTVVATGGLAKKIVPYCRREIILDEELLLKGLLVIYEKNSGSGSWAGAKK
ncbi:MAG: type III pantothenate kinase [Eubacteriales bacterium]|nr:type III pantothenate kinase [Eubacteriales bacterium]